MRVWYEKKIEGQIEPVDQIVKNVDHVEFYWENNGYMLKVFTKGNDESILVNLDDVWSIDDK